MTSSALVNLRLGTSVAVSVALNAFTHGGAVPPPLTGNNVTVDIKKTTGTEPVAPAGVWLEAINLDDFVVSNDPQNGSVYDPTYHEITYIWTIKNAPLPAFSAPQNMIPQWNNPNLAYGQRVAFTLTMPGTYEIELFAIDKFGNHAKAETTITVAEPDAVFTGTRTICYSNDPNETWAEELPGSMRISSMTSLQAAIESAGLPARILLKRGQTIPDFYLLIDNDLLGYMGAWGTGAMPVVTPPRNKAVLQFWDGANMSPDITISQIRFQGRWDSTTETGYPDENPLWFSVAGITLHITIDGNIFDGFTTLKPFGGSAHDYTTIFSNNVVTNWRDYGMFCAPNDAARVGLIGNRMTQHVDALNGGPKNGLHNSHGPFRGASNADTYLAMNDFFSRCGWSGLNPDRADQPCLRLNYDFRPDIRCTIDRNVCEGGFMTIITQGNNNSADPPGNYVLDKNLCIGTSKMIFSFIKMERGGTTVRNVVGVMPNVAHYHGGNSLFAGVYWRMDGPTLANQISPISVHSSSFINSRDSVQDPGFTWDGSVGHDDFSNATIENNLVDGQLLDTPVYAPVNLIQTLPGVSARYNGVRYGFNAETGTFSGDVAPNQSALIPYPNGTDQAYWLGASGSNRHIARIALAPSLSVATFCADLGDFNVTYQANGILMTNLSADTWAGSATWEIKLDRIAMIPTADPAYSSVGLPLALPNPFGQTAQSDVGLHAYDDFFGHVRPGPGGIDHLGQVRPASGNKAGAIFQLPA